MSYKNLKKPNCRFLTALALGLTLTLAGCGSGGKKGEGLLGDPAAPAPGTSSSSSSGATSSSGSTSSVGTFPDPDTGATVKATVAAEAGDVAFGASKKITLTFTDSAGKAFASNVKVDANSNCITTLKGSTISTPELSGNVLTFVYSNQGCRGDDWVSFTTGTTTVSKLGSVKIVTIGEDVASIQFVKADPQKIYIAGEGTPKESLITFRVLGQGGKPLADQPIVFNNAGTSGGVTLITASDTSDKDGLVEMRVKAGTVPTTVSIKALHEKSKVEGFSGGLEVTAAMPIITRFSIAPTKYNIRSFNRINAETTDIVARISDSAGNSVPDGTIVRFESREGGSIDTCRTVGGTCASVWTPGGKQSDDGRVQVMAYVQGVEVFKDNNSNNVFDDGDTFEDLPEPFSDDNTNGQYELGEFFADANNNGKRDVEDGKWNGVNCKHSTLCGPASQLVNLSQQTTLYLSSGAYEICELGEFAKPIWVKPKGTTSVGGMFISDGNDAATNPGFACNTGNPLPNGTKITFTASSGTLKGGTGGAIEVGANQLLPIGSLGVIYEAPAEAGSQFLTMKVEIPGVVTVPVNFPIYISDTPPDDTGTPEPTNGTFIDPTLNQKVWVDIAAASGNVDFETTREITLTFRDELSQSKILTSSFTASSACTISSRSQISAANIVNNTVKFLYTSKGCVGDDVVTFSATGNAKTVAVGSYKLVTSGEAVGGITFVSANPSQIPIATGGSGSGSLATVTFKVVGQSGNGVAGENVNFSIVGGAGGVALVNVAAVSDGSGLVKTQVRSGTTPNNVTVLATVESNGSKASSLGLAVASGLSFPGRFSIALDKFNPHAYGWDSGAGVVNVSATVADVSGNPVLDGTLVNFTSPEGGLITPTCLTVKGRCTVGFQSTGVEPDDGRITIAATVKGIERFTDNNGNLLFDNGDTFTALTDDTYEPFTDLNDDGIYQLGEPFVDSNLDRVRSAPDGKWNGLNCTYLALCGEANKLIDIQDTAVISLSGASEPTVCKAGDFGAASLTVAPGGTISLGGLYLSDGNTAAVNPAGSPCLTGNSMPGGTKVTFSVSTGTLLAPKESIVISDYTRVPNGSFSTVITAPTTPGVIVLTMKVEYPPHLGGKDQLIYYTNWTIKVE